MIHSAPNTTEQFQHSDLVYDAVLHNLQIIGEAARNVPDDLRQRFPAIEWRKISGFRDIVAQQYFSISDSIVWDIVKNKIPVLASEVEKGLHLITNPAIQGMLQFILNNKPGNLHLVILNRTDPPWPRARLRARNRSGASRPAITTVKLSAR